VRPTLVLALACTVCACGGDDGGSTPTTTGVTTIGNDDGSGSAGDESTTTAATSEGSSSEGEGSSSSGDPGETTVSLDDTAGTTGEPADPEYPAPDGTGMCPEGTADLDLAGATACAPFCAGADAPCPTAATGSATPECTPFEMPGGSGDPCETHDECSGEEACGVNGTCVAVAFWGCRLLCDAGELCPDAMICSGVGACGYP
jgi:hypothetical protein